jgi:hypothetical protein
MCTRCQCQKAVGQWVQFRTPYGYHRGVVERVAPQGVLMRVPRAYAPTSLASAIGLGEQTDEQRLDLALAQWGYGAPANGAPGYAAPGYGYANGWWAAGWWWWWIAFAAIFWLAFLW